MIRGACLPVYNGAMDWMSSNWLDQLSVVGTVALAAVLGGAIGFERELSDKPAGLRTHAILAAAACLLVGLSDPLLARFITENPPAVLRADPIRVVEAIVTGTAFLGAGTIFVNRGKHVEGLTTAASLLLVAALGIAVALHQWVIAVATTVLALVVLRLIRRVIEKSALDKDKA